MSNLIEIITYNPLFFYFTIGCIGLIFGSFLNAAIYRIPIMLEQEWKQSCIELNTQEGESPSPNSQPFNLFFPRSQCPNCKQLITTLQNIPIISYLLLKGRCKQCKTNISIQYPIIEAVSTLLSLLIAYYYGPTLATLGLLFFMWALIVLSMIDLKKMYLPDNITLPFLWLGIILNMSNTYTDLYSSTLGAIIGYLCLWSIYQLFKLITGKEGMGYGDFKLLAMIGAWGGWQILPFVVFSSALTGAIGGSLVLLLQKKSLQKQFPFGPALALSGLIALIWRNDILQLTQQVVAP